MTDADATKNSKVEKVSKDMAQAEFDRWAEAMDLDLDTEAMSQDDREGAALQKHRIIKALQRGRLVINDKGEAEYTPHHIDVGTLTFSMHSGSALMAMDASKAGKDMRKTFAVMGEITKVHSKTFADMMGPDLNVCLAITLLFLG